MGKIDIVFRSKSRQSGICCVKQGVCRKIIHRSEPFALYDLPQSLRDIPMKKKDKQASFFPTRQFFYEPSSSFRCCLPISCIILIFAIVGSIKVRIFNGRTITKVMIKTNFQRLLNIFYLNNEIYDF